MLDRRYLNTGDIINTIASEVERNIPVVIGNPTQSGLNLKYASLVYSTNLQGEPVLVIEVDQYVHLERDDNE